MDVRALGIGGLLVCVAFATGLAGEGTGPRVRVDGGVLEGVRSSAATDSVAFRGIPYAASPAGAWRWKPPRPAPAWEGVRLARELGPVCPQSDRGIANLRRLTLALGGDPAWVPPLGPISEDCLSLNVFTTHLDRPPRRPVIVWIHGGANRVGSGAEQAAALARYGAVVVTLNYRLGLLGFMAHPALSRESPRGVSGNYALLDQVEALRWVRRNIAAFGGDPDRVTIVGHSAGGDSVMQLLASPLARGLFHRAVAQSGGLGTSRPRAEMEAEGVKVASRLGAPAGDPLPALRALPAEQLVAAVNGPFDAVADGWVLAAPGPSALGARPELPLLVGATSDEANAFALPEDLQGYRTVVEEVGSAWSERVAALYPATKDEQARAAVSRLVTDRDFVCPARYIAAKRRGPTWLYRFSAPATPGPVGDRLGAFHGSDVRLLFDLTYGVPQGSLGESVGEALRRYWVSFAASGDPNVGGLPAWPAYDGRKAHLELGDPIRVVAGLGGDGCDLFDKMWDSLYAAP